MVPCPEEKSGLGLGVGKNHELGFGHTVFEKISYKFQIGTST